MKFKKFLFTILFLISFWIGNHALAADILEYYQSTGTNVLYWSNFQISGQRYIAQHNNISMVGINSISDGQLSSSARLIICSGYFPSDDNGSYFAAHAPICDYNGDTTLYNEPAVPTSVNGEMYYFKFPTPLSMVATSSIFMVLEFGDGTHHYEPNYAPGGNGMIWPASNYAGSWAFKIYYSDTWTPPATFQINLLTPSPTAPFTTYYGQPASYTFTYENPLNWYPQIRFMVKRKADAKASAWPDYINSSTFWTSGVASSTLTYATSTFTLPDGYYDLDAYFWANIPASPVHATTTFTINTGGTYGGYSFATSTLLTPPTFSTADLCGDIATTTTFGAIECGLIRAFVGTITWAFAPSFDTLTNFRVSFELFKGCFPFNTYFQLTDTITSVASSTASTTAGTIKIPFIHSITGGGTFYMLDAVSSSTLSNWIGVSNYNLFRTTIGYFFWLIAAAVVFFTVKYI